MRIFVLLLAFAGCSSGAPPVDLGSSVDLASAGPTPDLAAVTWTTFAQPFSQHYCVSCHSPGGQASQQDFNQYAVVKANAAHIRCGTAPVGMLPSGCSGNPSAGQFPIGTGPMPTDAERQTLVGWIDDGAPM
ncbi:MAG: hypothetical protein ABI321_21510 [Polyangia bacterium]